jgi:hypothetical protein
MEYIIKENNNQLYNELINFNKNQKIQRVTIPSDKLSFLNTGNKKFLYIWF